MIDLINDWKKDQQQLRNRFDSNKDGNIDQQEWESARQLAQSQAQQIHDQLVLKPDEHIIAKPDNSGRPFIISVYSQALLTRKFRQSAHMTLTGCFVLIGYIAWLVHSHG